ncbi:MAG: lysophospholipase [Paraglaciecola sp.]|jgi:lysophospholipase
MFKYNIFMQKNYILSTEQSLESSFSDIINPFWQERVKSGKFAGVDDISIRYAYVLHPEAIASVVISSGRIESLIKYKEVVFDLYQNGYSIFINDHRGQGLSGRLVDNRQMGYVEDFDDYVRDLKTLVEQVVKPNSSAQIKLLCHSMGGTIGALYCLAHPEDFEQVAFSAPMFGIRPPMPDWLANVLVNTSIGVNNLFSKQASYFIGQQDYVNKPFAANPLTQSEMRYAIFRQEYEDNAQIKLGGVSGHWLKAAAQAMNKVEKLAPQFPVPALVIQAGADKVVDNKRQDRVSLRLANSEKIVVDDAKHELLMEKDCYRQPCLRAILDFFSHGQ